jgi:hypothetical protein
VENYPQYVENPGEKLGKTIFRSVEIVGKAWGKSSILQRIEKRQFLFKFCSQPDGTVGVQRPGRGRNPQPRAAPG